MVDVPQQDHDSPWKEVLESRFPEFLALLFPTIHVEVDWSRGTEFLDKELQKVVRDAELGRRHTDKLVKVWAHDGSEAWVLIHVEVQGEAETAFTERMYVYHYRLFDRYKMDVVSLGVLADTSAAFQAQCLPLGALGLRDRVSLPYGETTRLAGALGGVGGERQSFRPGDHGAIEGQGER